MIFFLMFILITYTLTIFLTSPIWSAVFVIQVFLWFLFSHWLWWQHWACRADALTALRRPYGRGVKRRQASTVCHVVGFIKMTKVALMEDCLGFGGWFLTTQPKKKQRTSGDGEETCFILRCHVKGSQFWEEFELESFGFNWKRWETKCKNCRRKYRGEKNICL